jgi:hypothetical protein
MKGNGCLCHLERSCARRRDGLGALDHAGTAERVGITGFLACRIFRAIGTAANRYFILYDLESAEVVGGQEYLARLNSPTP